ncbi:MAG: cytidylyltransferase domain-containing protein [Nitrospirota bacterium]
MKYISENLITALVPMKDHSERVPNKNIREFCGRPLYHWIINSLKDSRYIKEVVINTDSERIARDAEKNFDLRIIDRPKNLRGDFVPMNDIIACDISQLQEEYFLQTHSTNPLLKTETIDKSIEAFIKQSKFDSLFSTTKIQTRLYWGDGSAVNHNPEELLRTQDLPPVFEENSNIYIFTSNSFSKNNRRIGDNPMMFEIDKTEALDIDNETDFLISELMMKIRLGDNKR